MTTAIPSLPNFQRPPVKEVALAAQFEPLEGLEWDDFALIREAFRADYPRVEEHPPLGPMAIDAAPQEIQLNIIQGGVPRPNLWFISEDGNRLIQFQPDRLVVNWRREVDEAYPRYQHAIRPMFESAWQHLSEVLEKVNAGPLRPNVCEVVYVNPIDAGKVWQSHNQAHLVVAPWSAEYSDDFLPAPSELRLAARYPLPDDAGALVIALNPAQRSDTGTPAIMLQLAARGAPRGAGLDGVMAFFDLAREWIVRGFVSFTTPEMHEEWGETK